MEVKQVAITELKEYSNNLRLISEDAVEKVAQSIQRFGFKVPIIVDENNVIVAGHTRRKAAITLGLEEVPVIVANDLTEEQVKAFRLADNKVSEFSTWEFDQLRNELEALDELNVDMEDFGFGEISIDDVLPINDENIERGLPNGRLLTIDRTKVQMTEEEYEKITQLLDKYIDENGVSFGFVGELCNL